MKIYKEYWHNMILAHTESMRYRLVNGYLEWPKRSKVFNEISATDRSNNGSDGWFYIYSSRLLTCDGLCSLLDKETPKLTSPHMSNYNKKLIGKVLDDFIETELPMFIFELNEDIIPRCKATKNDKLETIFKRYYNQVYPYGN